MQEAEDSCMTPLLDASTTTDKLSAAFNDPSVPSVSSQTAFVQGINDSMFS